jgi:hypothetical protein
VCGTHHRVLSYGSVIFQGEGSPPSLHTKYVSGNSINEFYSDL